MLQPPPLPRNLEASFRDLASQKAAVRVSAVADVVRHARGDEAIRARALPLLEKALAGDEVSQVRSAAAVALADLHASESLPKLLVAVEDPDVHVRQMALSALGEIGDVRALPRLRRALSDERPEVRYQAIIAFVRLAEAIDDAREAVTRATEDDDAAVRYIALRLAEERVDEGRHGAWEPLAERAEAMLADDNEHVAVAAAILLAKLGRAAGRELLLDIVRGKRRAEKEDEREAVQMAGELDLREATDALERRAYGAMRLLKDTCAYQAKVALARLGHARAREEFARDLTSTRREVREAAVVAAGRARIAAMKDAIAKLGDDDVDPALRDEALALLGKAATP